MRSRLFGPLTCALALSALTAEAQDAAPAAPPAGESQAAEVPEAEAQPETPIAPAPAPERAATEEVEPAPAPAEPDTSEPLAPEPVAAPAETSTAPVPTPAVAPASGFTPVYSGSYFSRFEARRNYGPVGVARPRFVDGDSVFYRARFGIGTGPMNVGNDLKVALQFTPQASGRFGELSSTIADANLGLHEGYLRVQGSLVYLDTGRFELNYGDALILGNLAWHQTARSFDGMRARIAPQAGYFIDLFATQPTEGLPAFPDFAEGDVYFLGVYAGLGPAITSGLELDLYAFARLWGNTVGLPVDATVQGSPTYEREKASEGTLGARAKQRLGVIDYRLETGVQLGTRPGPAPSPTAMPPAAKQLARDVFAYHIDAELGLHVVSDRLRIAAEGILASGDDPTTADKHEGWDELFPTGHKFLGLSDAFAQSTIKRTNVMSGVMHLQGKVTESIKLNIDSHLFLRPEAQVAGGATGLAAAEIDIETVYTLAKGLNLRGMYAMFLPQDDFYVSTDTVHYLEIELGYQM